MKRAGRLKNTAGIVLFLAAGLATAASNPINQNYVTLSSADWEAACTAGTTAAGCFGNIGSTAYRKLDRLLQSPATVISLIPQSVPNSIYIKKYGPGGAVMANTGSYTVSTVTGATVVCVSFTQNSPTFKVLQYEPGPITVFNSTNLGIFTATAFPSNATMAIVVSIKIQAGGGTAPADPIVPLYVICYGLSAQGLSTVPQSLTGLVVT